jgi:ribosomal protein S18 acetylase RimI-like enzyme
MAEEIFVRNATENDVQSITRLVNAAYRGASSRQGWTTEANLLDGIRTDEENILLMLRKKDAVIKIAEDASKKIAGCVYLEKQKSEMYLGMLTVDPEKQNNGIGKLLLNASENYAMEQNATAIVMSVISVRSELIEWYQRHQYEITGEVKPFPDDTRFGVPKQFLEFLVLRKALS